MNENEPQTIEQLREEVEALLGSSVRSLSNLVEESKSKTQSIKCPHCSGWSKHPFDIDADLMVKVVNALSQAVPRLKGKDESSVKAAKIISDFSELSSHQIAEEIARLEALIDNEEG